MPSFFSEEFSRLYVEEVTSFFFFLNFPPMIFGVDISFADVIFTFDCLSLNLQGKLSMRAFFLS